MITFVLRCARQRMPAESEQEPPKLRKLERRVSQGDANSSMTSAAESNMLLSGLVGMVTAERSAQSPIDCSPSPAPCSKPEPSSIQTSPRKGLQPPHDPTLQTVGSPPAKALTQEAPLPAGQLMRVGSRGGMRPGFSRGARTLAPGLVSQLPDQRLCSSPAASIAPIPHSSFIPSPGRDFFRSVNEIPVPIS